VNIHLVVKESKFRFFINFAFIALVTMSAPLFYFLITKKYEKMQDIHLLSVSIIVFNLSVANCITHEYKYIPNTTKYLETDFQLSVMKVATPLCDLVGNITLSMVLLHIIIVQYKKIFHDNKLRKEIKTS
jgi:hypothetical protein